MFGQVDFGLPEQRFLALPHNLWVMRALEAGMEAAMRELVG
jgi:hypothetical protein